MNEEQQFDRDILQLQQRQIEAWLKNGQIAARVFLEESDLGLVAGVLHATGMHRIARQIELACYDLRVQKQGPLPRE